MFIESSSSEIEGSNMMFILFNYCMTKTKDDIATQVKKDHLKRFNEIKILYLPKKSRLRDRNNNDNLAYKKKPTKMLKIGVTRANFKMKKTTVNANANNNTPHQDLVKFVNQRN